MFFGKSIWRDDAQAIWLKSLGRYSTGARLDLPGDGEKLLQALWICPWLSQEVL